MAVNDFAKAVLATANQIGIPLRPGTTVPWLSGLGHSEPGARKARPEVLDRLAQLHSALGGDGAALTRKRRRAPKLDFWLRDGELDAVELDEIQHFTSYRLQTLDFYDGLAHGLDLSTYRLLCERHHKDAARAFGHKTAKDFSFRGGRAAQRAYLDAVRDLLGPALGYRIIRIPAADSSVQAAVAKLKLLRAS